MEPNKDKVFKILSIDGGGVRGILPAKFLSLMEEKLGVSLHKDFDMVVGTSTGSIIAAAIAVDYNMSQLAEDYRKHSKDIFRKRWSLKGMCRSEYDSKPLSQFLHEKFGEVKLGEINHPLILNATNASIGDVHVFKSSYQLTQRKGDYVRDGEVPLYKAVLASCSAPLYFDPVDIDGTLVCDGGLWANNPALVGYTDAIRNFKKTNIKILSLGTGRADIAYKSASRWGFLTGWKKEKLVDFMMSCQTRFPSNVLSLIDEKTILRITPEISGNFPLDKCENIPTLLEEAKSLFTKQSSELQKFLTL